MEYALYHHLCEILSPKQNDIETEKQAIHQIVSHKHYTFYEAPISRYHYHLNRVMCAMAKNKTQSNNSYK